MGAKQAGADYQVVALIFAGRKEALSINEDLKTSGKHDAYGVVASAVVEIDAAGKPHFGRSGHSAQGAAIGILTGGILGLIGGPEGLLVWTVLGAVVGSQVGKRLDGPIPQQDLRQLVAQMQPGTSAILVLVPEVRARPFIDALAGYKPQIVQLNVSDHVSGDIN